MVKGLSHRDMVRKLRRNGCTIVSGSGPHTKWQCRCGQHSANIPRHSQVSAGVVRDTIARLTCLPKGWLQ